MRKAWNRQDTPKVKYTPQYSPKRRPPAPPIELEIFDTLGPPVWSPTGEIYARVLDAANRAHELQGERHKTRFKHCGIYYYPDPETFITNRTPRHEYIRRDMETLKGLTNDLRRNDGYSGGSDL